VLKLWVLELRVEQLYLIVLTQWKSEMDAHIALFYSFILRSISQNHHLRLHHRLQISNLSSIFNAKIQSPSFSTPSHFSFHCDQSHCYAI
jgi:hypothetical protein